MTNSHITPRHKFTDRWYSLSIYGRRRRALWARGWEIPHFPHGNTLI